MRGIRGRTVHLVPLLFAWLPAACAGVPPKLDPAVGLETLVPASIPTDRSALEPLTAALRAKAKTLGLNGLSGLKGEPVSRALVLLPKNRVKAGVISFELEDGPDAGPSQCEALGRGVTTREPRPGWPSGAIGKDTLFYAPMDAEGGATIPGVYDVRNITPAEYEIELLNGPEDLRGEDDVLARVRGSGPKPRFSAVWKHWYSRTNRAVPIDMTWSESYQPASQGAGLPVFERRPEPKDEVAKQRMQRQLAHDRRYYRGPYGRYGFANHTDRWDDPDRRADIKLLERPELSDFRYRDTNGCIKVRPDCLERLNRFIAEQDLKGRRVQYDVRETPLLDALGEPADNKK